MPWEITPLGDSAVIVRVADSLGDVLTTMRKLEAAKIPGVVEIAPAFASVALFFTSPRELAQGTGRVRVVLRRRSPLRRARKQRVIEVPVCYEPEYGLDLEIIAERSNLPPNEIARRHAGAAYQVRCIGFTPGFPYLSGLPKALATPRRAAPRLAVPAGSVAIGGAQTGIYPQVSPGGWNIIGRTPLRLFNVAREPAALFRAGDQVRFVAITAAEFSRWGR